MHIWDHFIVRSKLSAILPFALSNALSQFSCQIGPVKIFVPQFLGAEKTGEAMWVNNLPKVAAQENGGMAGMRTPDLSARKPVRFNHYATEPDQADRLGIWVCHLHLG